jgi:hypothetical protein
MYVCSILVRLLYSSLVVVQMLFQEFNGLSVHYTADYVAQYETFSCFRFLCYKIALHYLKVASRISLKSEWNEIFFG